MCIKEKGRIYFKKVYYDLKKRGICTDCKTNKIDLRRRYRSRVVSTCKICRDVRRNRKYRVYQLRKERLELVKKFGIDKIVEKVNPEELIGLSK